MTDKKTNLIKEDLIFLETAKDSKEAFKKVGSKLLDKGLVKHNFVAELVKRERDYPTGIDMKFAHNDDSVINIAIPHTEVEYSNTKNLVVVKLEDEIEFRNMIKPEENLKVKFLFIILNNSKENQTNILSNIMSFLSIKENILDLSNADTVKEIYNILVNNQDY